MNLGILYLGMTGDTVGASGMRVAQSAGLLVMLPVAAIEIIIQPHFSQLSLAKDPSELAELYKRSARISFVSALIVGLPMIIFAEPLIRMTFGESYLSVATGAVQIIGLARILHAAMGPSGILLAMSSKERLAMWAQGTALTLTVVILITLAPILSSTGAALGIALGLIGKISLEAYFLRRVYGYWFSIFMRVPSSEEGCSSGL